MRSIMRVALVALTAGVVGLITMPSAADASVEWCFEDPIVEIGGQRVSITIAVQGEPAQVRQNVRRARVSIYVPDNVRTRLISQTNTFFDEDVDFRTLDDVRWQAGDPIPVLVRVTFDSRTRYNARVDVEYRGGNERETGTTNSRIWTAFVLD